MVRNIYNNIVSLMKNLDISYEEYEHEPILDYEKAKELAAVFKWEGTESKSLMLKDKEDRLYVFITLEGKRIDTKKAKNITLQKLSICSGEELIERTGCVPGCVSPLGYSEGVTFIVDNEIFLQDKLLFSPGLAEKTFIVKASDMKKMIGNINNKIYFY
ncbi:MAG: YbaK/EbsC family protein [Proteocatella sp.]